MDYEEVERYQAIDSEINQHIRSQNLDAVESLRGEQDSLGRFIPWMTHSFSESSKHVVFHAQILADWGTALEISDKLLQELNS